MLPLAVFLGIEDVFENIVLADIRLAVKSTFEMLEEDGAVGVYQVLFDLDNRGCVI